MQKFRRIAAVVAVAALSTGLTAVLVQPASATEVVPSARSWR